MKRLCILAISLLLVQPGDVAAEIPKPDEAQPYREITEPDVARLDEFAKRFHVDLIDDLDRAYGENGSHDKEALARLFRLSVAFTEFDDHARIYGQIVWNSVLNLGECMGVEGYAKVIDQQTPDVQQRVRDFLYYPLTLDRTAAGKEAEASARGTYPTLFPSGFVFGQNDTLFSERNDESQEGVTGPTRTRRSACAAPLFSTTQRRVRRSRHRCARTTSTCAGC